MDAYNRTDRKFLRKSIRKRQAPPLTHYHPAIPLPLPSTWGASEVVSRLSCVPTCPPSTLHSAHRVPSKRWSVCH